MEKIYAVYKLPDTISSVSVKDKHLIAFSENKKYVEEYVKSRYSSKTNTMVVKHSMDIGEMDKFFKTNRAYCLKLMEYKYKDKENLKLSEMTILSNDNEFEWLQMEFQAKLDSFSEMIETVRSFLFKEKYREALRKLNFSLLEVYWDNPVNREIMKKILNADEYNDIMIGPSDYEIDEVRLLVELFLNY